jgi:hypothetical protein
MEQRRGERHHIDIEQDEAMADDLVEGPINHRSLATLVSYEYGEHRSGEASLHLPPRLSTSKADRLQSARAEFARFHSTPQTALA